MAEGIKISQMQEKANLEGTEYIPIVDGSSNKKVKTDKILTKEEAEENYQEKLISGTSIKTINNQTVLGSGNIEINVPDTSNLATKTELTNSLSSKLDVTTYNSDKANFATKDEIPDVSDVLTKTEASDVYQVKGNYLTQSSLDNYITVEDLAAGLEDYAITDEVNIELAKKVDVTTYNSDKANYITNSDISDMLTKTEANTLYQEKGNYALSTDIPTKVSDLTNDSEYQTATQVDDRIEGIIGSAPEVLDTLTKLAENLGSGDELTTLINEVGNKVDKTTYETDKATFATKTELEDKVDKSTYDFDKTTFATKTELTNKLDTTTYNQDKVNFATKSDLDSYATTSDLVGKLDVSTYNSDKTNFATKSEINNFASKSDLDSKLDASVYNQDKINFATKTELTNYATVSSVESKLDTDIYNTEKTTFALKTEIPNTSDMLTKTEAESKYQKIGDYALKSDIPTVPTKVSELVNDSNYQTENEVSSLLENYQEKLVSGTNIKTLNGQDLIGEGNIEIVGSGEGIADAPADSKLYGRKDNNWEEITLPDISEYLTETEANELYQEKGDYAFKSELPTVPTKVSELANDSNYQTANDVDNRVQEIIGSAPEALDTLKEISDALNNDPNFAATITTELSKKVDKIEGKQLSTEDYTTEDKEKLAGIDTSIYAKNEDLVYIADTVIPQMNENTAKALDQKVDWDTEKKVISLPSDGSISALRNSETLEGGVLLAQRTYDEGVTYVTEVGTTKNKLTLNATERPQIDIQGGTSERIAYESDLRTVPIEVNLPTAVIRGIIKKTYTQEEILGWFGFDEVAKLKSAIVSNGLMYIRYGIQLSGNPYYYRMPVQYCAFESANQLKIVSIGLDTSNDKPNKITIIFNLDGTLINEVSNVEITFDELNEDIDLTSYLTKDDASNTYQVKGNYALKSEIPDIMSVGMYYPGVKVDSQKLFALTKESTEDDIKAALQIEVASGGYKLPTSEILDDCLGKGYQLLSNWMPVSIAWNGAAYVFYTVGQNYMMKPSGLYTVAISISAEGNYSVFQAGKLEEFALTSNISETIDTPYEINLTNLLSAEDSNAISEAIGGIDNLRNIVHTNRMIVGIINSGSVSVSIRIFGQTTTLYYVLDTVAGYTVNEINIVNTDGTLSKNIKSHSMMTEEMVVNDLTTDQSTLPLSAAQGKILNDSITDIKKTYIVDLDNTDEAKQVHLEIVNKYSEIVTGDNRVPVNDVFVKNKRVLGLSGASNLIPISGARIKSGTVHFFTDFPVQLQWADLPTNTNFGPIEVYFEADGEAKVITVNTLIDSGGYILNYSNGGLKAKATLKLNDSGSISLIGHDDEHAISTINLQDIYAKKDEVSNKQDTLVSGTNIKTINGSSLLGEGNINTPTKTSELTNDSNFVTGVGVNKIQVVTELPEVQEDGVLYLVIKSE